MLSAYSFHTVQTREEAELEELMSSLGDPDTFFTKTNTQRQRRETACVLSQYKSMLLMFSAAAAA